jgi:hypothetical protein
MESMRESWTDKRPDDLNLKVDRIDADLRALRLETRTEFTALRGEMQQGFNRIDERLDSLHRMLLQFAGLLVAALIGLAGSQL